MTQMSAAETVLGEKIEAVVTDSIVAVRPAEIFLQFIRIPPMKSIRFSYDVAFIITISDCVVYHLV